MSVRMIAADDQGHILAEGRYAGQWNAYLDCFANADTATLNVRRKGVARWLFAYWSTGTLMGVCELAPRPQQRLSVQVGGSLTLPVGEWFLMVEPFLPAGAPSVVG